MNRLTAFLAYLALNLWTPTAFAGASEWFHTDGARMRLIAMPSTDGKRLDAGLEFELQDGWKTYWREPGGSGIPPQVHFLGSKNVLGAVMHLPVPKLYNDDSGRAIGYKKHVVFPIDVSLKRPLEDVTLNASGIVGVCGTICVPVQFQLSMTQTAKSGTRFDIAAALRSAKSQVPLPSNANQHVVSVTDINAKPRQLIIETRVPKEAKTLQLFTEGPSHWYISSADLVSRNGTSARFTLPLPDVKEDKKVDGTTLRMTLVADGNGTDQKISVSPLQKP